MHDYAFAVAARQAPVTILRLPMLPYSVGHEIILLSDRNPLLFDAATPDEQGAGLIRAALVCRRTWAQNQKPERNIGLWCWMNRKTDWLKEVERFKAYRLAGSDSPPSPTKESYEIASGLQNEEEGREFGGSYYARLVAYCVRIHRSLGCETAFDVPFGLANHIYLAELEMAGNVRIENAREAQVKAEMDGHRAAIEKERAACPP